MSRLPRLTIGINAVLLAAPSLGGAQVYAAQDGQPPAAPFQRLHVGDRVRIVTLDGRRLTGKVSDLSAQSLTLLLADGTTSVVPAARAGRIVLRDPLRNGASMGAAIGAGAGLAIGLAADAVFANEGGSSGGAVLGLAGLGAAIGAGVGLLADAARLQTVYDGMPGSPSGLIPEVTIGGAAGRLNAAGLSGLRMPLMAAGWGVRYQSGLAMEFQGQRSLGRTRVPAGPDGGQKGVEGETMGTARVLYYFSDSRVQPYAGGGVSFFESVVWGPQLVFSQFGSQTREVRRKERGAAGVAAVGLRFVLTPRLTVRPEIALQSNGRWTALLAGAALGIRW
jgi:hypothetical protein